MSEGARWVRDHHDAQRKRGLQLVRVWVPKEDAQRIRDQAKAMRAEAGLPLPTDNSPPFPGWAYLRVGREEKEFIAVLREHGARWIRDGQVWRLRADLVDKLDVRNRVCDWEPGSRSRSSDLDR